jgi:hypothetical protein
LINALAGEAASCNEVTPEQKERHMARILLCCACLIISVGDSYLRFGSTNMLYAGSGVPWINYPYPANNRHSLHINLGIGVRF